MGSKNCVPIPQWKNDCGSGYDKNECVHICRDGVMDVYKSLENDNKDEPVKGSRKDNPTWAFRSTCAAMEPNPIVTGPNVVPVLDEVTGVIEYQITPAVDTDTVVTYTFNQTNPVNGDGIIEFTVTPSDGGADQFITLPEPTVDTDTNNDWTASALSPAGILTYTGTDGQGNPIAMPPVDLTPLISPALLAGDNITLDVDPNTGAVTISGTDHTVDTDTFVTYDAVQTTNSDGSTTTTITVTPAGGGTPVVTTIVSGEPSCPDVFNRVVDEDGRTITSSGCDTPLELDRSLHVSSPSHYLNSNKIGVSHSDSDQTDTGEITNTHLRGVSTSVRCQSTGAMSHCIASNDSLASGNRGTVISSGLSGASGLFSSVISSQNSNATSTDSTVIGSNSCLASGGSSGVYSSTVSTASGSVSGILATRDSTASGLKSTIIGSQSCTTDSSSGGIYSSVECDITGANNANAIISSESSSLIRGNNNSVISSLTVVNDSLQMSSIIASTGNSRTGAVVNGSAAGAGGQQAIIASTESLAGGGNQMAVVASDGSEVGNFQAGAYSTRFGKVYGLTSAAISGQNGLVTDNFAISLSGGQANTGVTGTFAHGNGIGGAFTAAVPVGFRGATPQPARVVATLADVILALQEQGLAA